MSKKHPEKRSTEETSIIQPIIDELKADSPPELPMDDDTPPPRGPIHPPQPEAQPVEHHPDAGRDKPDSTDS
jgi:hypothetical protein